MIREEFCTEQTFNSIIKTYYKYLAMRNKYEGVDYNFSFFDEDYTLVMRSEGFHLYDSSASDEGDSLFSIRKFDGITTPWWYYNVLDEGQFCFTTHNPMYITVGDHQEFDSRMVSVYDDIEETLEIYPEEWFFQQLTRQNIISFEQFQKELNFCFLFLKEIMEPNVVISFSDYTKFDISLLSGFKVL